MEKTNFGFLCAFTIFRELVLYCCGGRSGKDGGNGGNYEDDVRKTGLQQYVRATFSAETSLELPAAVRVDDVILRFIGSEMKFVAVHP